MTLSERLEVTAGRPAGFDYLRIGLAVSIVVWHTVVVCYGFEFQQVFSSGPSRPVWAMILPMFFALSGFLVSGSLERSRTLVSFLGLRVLRLLPALLVESLIAMLIIGPLFTNLPLSQYFRDTGFWAYTGNMVGSIHFFLPGVFTTNPSPQFNGQLWTLPSELRCYMVIAIFAVLGFYRLRKLLLVGCIVAQIYCVYRYSFDPRSLLGGVVQGNELVLAFLFGTLLFRYRDSIPYSNALFAVSLLSSLVFLTIPVLAPLAAFPAAYATTFLGLTNPRRNRAVSSGDYSYSIFLYGFPIQQCVSYLLPDYRFWWLNLLIALPITIAVAYCSWHLVEKQALLLRPLLKRIEQYWVPYNNAVHRLSGRMLPPGLRVRWARN